MPLDKSFIENEVLILKVISGSKHIEDNMLSLFEGHDSKTNIPKSQILIPSIVNASSIVPIADTPVLIKRLPDQELDRPLYFSLPNT